MRYVGAYVKIIRAWMGIVSSTTGKFAKNCHVFRCKVFRANLLFYIEPRCENITQNVGGENIFLPLRMFAKCLKTVRGNCRLNSILQACFFLIAN